MVSDCLETKRDEPIFLHSVWYGAGDASKKGGNERGNEIKLCATADKPEKRTESPGKVKQLKGTRLQTENAH